MTIINFSLYSNANWTQLSIYLSKCVRADRDKEKNKLKKKKKHCQTKVQNNCSCREWDL